MRNTIISIISVILIAVYSMFSAIFTGNFTNEIRKQIDNADSNGYNISVAENLVEILEKNMPVLVLTSSKDHIDFMEECVVNLRYAIEYDDMQSTMIYKTLLLKIADEMDSMNKSPV